MEKSAGTRVRHVGLDCGTGSRRMCLVFEKEEREGIKMEEGFGASRRSGHHCRTLWCGRKPRRCRSRASRRLGCRDRWCEVQSRGSGPEWDSLLCRGGQSSRRCRRTDGGSPSFPALTHLHQNCTTQEKRR